MTDLSVLVVFVVLVVSTTAIGFVLERITTSGSGR